MFRRVKGPVSQWTAFDPARRYPLDRPYPDNAEMKRLFDADQAARAAGSAIDWSVIGSQDAARRVRAQALLDADALHSGTDYWEAGFVFQHGSVPADYLKAHGLAVVAAARGRLDASWIAAATLDRYLHAIGQPQVYGTQFTIPADGTATQQPYDRTILSDALRRATGVPDQAGQEEQRRAFDRAAGPVAR